MILVHKGIQPTESIIQIEGSRRDVRFELFKDGGYRIWTTRMLRSGCNKLVYGDLENDSLIYCEYCDEFFSIDQFEIYEGLE